uniref:EF-hand domain-containing protein n=1 Tax=Meloidogyne enterolobii TaxID=390850 RepID=A0A6V7WRN1_MELEN|nr:unnamed protein product [Meloidogyne enterolobii]
MESSSTFPNPPLNKTKIIGVSPSPTTNSLSTSIPLPRFEFTSPAESSREPSPSGGEESVRPLQKHQLSTSIVKPVIIQPTINNDKNKVISGGGGGPSTRTTIFGHHRQTRRQFSDNNLRPSLSPNGLKVGVSQSTSMDSNRRHSGQSNNNNRVSFLPNADKREQQSHQNQQQRLPLRAFKKIGRVGTLPAMAHSSAPHAGLQMAISGNEQTQQPQPTPNSALSSSRAAAVFHQRWGVGNSANRRGSHLIGGWDSARPHSAARQQQQMLERLYTKGELKEYQQLFKMFDTDGSGAIGSEELKGAMLRIGLEADDAEIERLIKEVDEDGNGEIDFPEFCQCMKTAERQGGFRQRPTNDEVVFDQDKNGLISENEFIYVAKEIGGFSHELAEFVFRELLGDSSADQLDMDRFSAIVEDYLLSDNNNGNNIKDKEDEEEENLNNKNNDGNLIKTKLF